MEDARAAHGAELARVAELARELRSELRDERGGTLWETREGLVSGFRCRTGHAFSPESLVTEQHEHVERALWAALRALEEKAAMLRRMSIRARDGGRRQSAVRLDRKANAILGEAVAVRSILRTLEPVVEAVEEEAL